LIRGDDSRHYDWLLGASSKVSGAIALLMRFVCIKMEKQSNICHPLLMTLETYDVETGVLWGINYILTFGNVKAGMSITVRDMRTISAGPSTRAKKEKVILCALS
jgi:hypothetical protein